ncbi:MAG: response regulator [Candidatus Omnitrophica bacterium]|nr:response regulator [Candidatus Omnitrophota bacterium]MCF7897466.1 response regulator [Candidatus Omnitrophota bacterium]MCF7909356.1 response regulator [Candidatus Omnitrophota bacterium]
MNKLKILVVDDNLDILDLIEATLESEFEVFRADSGSQAFIQLKENTPDLLILDYMLPDINGDEICKKIRQNVLLMNLPVLMLTGKGEVEDKVKGLESGADDYMTKPFLPQELIARIRMLIRRSSLNLDANPLTRLPGNISINKELENKLKTNEKFAVLYIDIDNFKALNDYYGFGRGDEVIKETSRILAASIQEKGQFSDFIGHIGGDDFVIITSIEKAEIISKDIISKFDSFSPNFFDTKDREKGYIEAKTRDGEHSKFSFPTISIGIITNEQKNFSHVAQIGSRGAELKGLAKKFPESKYIFDRRKD